MTISEKIQELVRGNDYQSFCPVPIQEDDTQLLDKCFQFQLACQRNKTNLFDGDICPMKNGKLSFSKWKDRFLEIWQKSILG